MKNVSLLARPVREVAMQRMIGSAMSHETDCLATEEPLEIRVEGHNIAIVMRTPGEDGELAAGFLVTEGLLHTASDLVDIRHQHHCLFSARDVSARRMDLNEPPPGKEASHTALDMNRSDGNVINVQLKNPEAMDLKKLTRHVFTSSSCGICSKSSIEAVRQQFPPIDDNFEVDPQVLFDLPAVLSSAQKSFKRTGGLHACALFDSTGNLLVIREDVGRHNALDKVIGWALLKDSLPLRQHILLLSGRTSFEMMQKALAAGVPIVAAISAPSSLAAEFARDSGQTLVGFLRGERMNIYAGGDRIRPWRSNGEGIFKG
ncbi:MAG: formate dehydrogenase accessory sulfurtransferase FdhD [Verrucomicrobiota bacterium]